ncbi:MAG: phosphate regulon sensor histidine kinase PhoR [Burkholderiales bacterium]
MSGFWPRELLKLFLFALLALIIGAAEGVVPALVFVVLMLLIGNLFHLKNLSRLTRWLTRSDSALVPDVTGSWEDLSAALYRMVKGTNQRREQLNRALDRFQQAAIAMPDGFVILDQRANIEWCNPAAERHFGLALSKDRGTDISYLVRQPEFTCYLRQQDSSEPLVLHLARSPPLAIAIQLVPYGDNQKLIISRDITQWEKAESARRDFVANVSHELRTPITVVSGFLETLSDMEKIDPSMLRRSIDLMRGESTRMHRLVEDLLTLSQLENGPPLVEDETIDVAALINELKREAEQLSNGKHRISAAIESSAELRGSLHEIRSALGNLVTNAIRYTPAGGSVHLNWSSDGGSATFAVHDTGVGIPAHHIPRLTERFYRVDRSRSRESGGTGLGLAIVKHILNRHQAQLDISSEPGQGSRFAAVFSGQRVVTRAPEPALSS